MKRVRSKTKKFPALLVGILLLMSLVTPLFAFVEPAAAAASFTLENPTKLANGTYTNGTLYIKDDSLKALDSYNSSKGLSLAYSNSNEFTTWSAVGGAATWSYTGTSPQTDTGDYWCYTASNTRGSLTLVVWQNGANGPWNIIARCNGSELDPVNANAIPSNAPFDSRGSIRQVTVNVSGTSTPTGPTKIPDTSAEETYAFTTGTGETINACKGVFAQFPGGCLAVTYDAGRSQQQSTTDAYYYANGTANGVCDMSVIITVVKADVKGGDQDSRPAKLRGGTISPILQTSSSPCKDGTDFAYKFFPQDNNGWVNFSKSITVTGKVTDYLQEGTTTAGTDEEDILNCGGGVLNWILCPVITVAQTSMQIVDNMIMSTLSTDAGTIFDTQICPATDNKCDNQQSYYKAWNSFRIIATALIVIAGLVMVAAQALGFEFLDAYTIRKVLPRLVIAIIGISLSWPLMHFVVVFFNTLGFDIRGLIYYPFSSIKAQLSVGTGLVAFIAPLGVLFAMGPAAFTLILTAGLALLVGFIVLIIRQVAIVLLIILAPLAIACSILPNTQKAWKMWFDNFLGLMLAFPIISAFIAAGHVFAVISINGASNQSGTAKLIAQIVGIVAYFMPYFMIPIALRLAAGFIGTIAGFVNDRHKGAFDRLKNARGNAMKNRHQMRMNEQMMKGKTGNLYRRLGSVGIPNSGALSMGRGGRAKYAAYRQNLRQQMAAEALKNDGGRAAGDDDATALAVQRGMTRGRFLEQYEAMGHSAQEAEMALAATERGFNAKIGSDAMALAAFKARSASSTAYSGDEAGTQQRFNEGAALINAGVMNEADAVAAGKGNRARSDINGAGFSTQMGLFREAAALQRQGQKGISQQRAQQHLDTTLQEAEPSDILAGNTRTIKALAPAMMRNLKTQLKAATNADGTVDLRHEGLNRALGQIAGVQDNLNRTSPQKAGMFDDLVNGQLLKGDAKGGDLTVMQMVNNAAGMSPDTRGIQTFLEVRKEYGSARAAQGAGAIGGQVNTGDEQP